MRFGKPNSNDTVTITTVKHRGDSIKTKDVPADWYHQMEKAEEVIDELENEYEDNDAIKMVTLSTGQERIGGKKEGIAVVSILPESDAGDSIPDEKRGIKIITEEYHEPELVSCNTDIEDPVPGGTRISSEDAGGCTSCCRMLDPDDNEYLLTAAHCLTICDDGVDNEKVFQPYDADQYVGKGDKNLASASRD